MGSKLAILGSPLLWVLGFYAAVHGCRPIETVLDSVPAPSPTAAPAMPSASYDEGVDYG